jgi:hypothetical protein
MRSACLVCIVIGMAGICVAQETSFSSGPQYLMTNGSPLFARPISTPSLSFDAPPATLPAAIRDAPVSETTGGSLVYTPSEALSHADLFPIYYGPPPTESSLIEITSVEPARNLPANFIDVGVAEVTTPQSLSLRGYGPTLAEAAAFWKMHKPRAPHLYTNRDIERVHGS